jgi:hypothetical protein
MAKKHIPSDDETAKIHLVKQSIFALTNYGFASPLSFPEK